MSGSSPNATACTMRARRSSRSCSGERRRTVNASLTLRSTPLVHERVHANDLDERQQVGMAIRCPGLLFHESVLLRLRRATAAGPVHLRRLTSAALLFPQPAGVQSAGTTAASLSGWLAAMPMRLPKLC